MPKQADIRVSIPACTAAQFWDAVYERPEATERYHVSYNASTSTSVTPWAACSRTVRFTMPLRMPDFVKRLVGLDCVAVTETQRVLWHGAGAFSVSSETAVGGAGAGRFTTSLHLSVTELEGPQGAAEGATAAADGGAAAAARPQLPSAAASAGLGGSGAGAGGVALVYGVRCAASSVPWPMAATIENLMADKALVSMQTFLDFCLQLLEEQAAGAQGAAGAPQGAGAAGEQPGAAAAPRAGPATGSAAAAAGSAAGPSSSGPPPLPSAASQRAPSLRHRWPSITCSHDLGGGGGGAAGGGGADPWVTVGAGAGAGADPFLLRRQDTLGGADVFWDAPETFTGGSGNSGSGTVPPHQLPPAGSLRRPSGDHACLHSGFAGAGLPTAAAVTDPVDVHHMAVAVERLTEAVAALDRKLDKLLVLQEQAAAAVAAEAAGTRERRRSGDGGGWSSSWMLRLVAALLAATLLTVGIWLLHPHATGFGPSGGSGSSSSSSGSSGMSGGGSAGLVGVDPVGAVSDPLPGLLRMGAGGGGGAAGGLGAGEVQGPELRLLRGGGGVVRSGEGSGMVEGSGKRRRGSRRRLR